jgi:hypothetical protein
METVGSSRSPVEPNFVDAILILVKIGGGGL